MKKLSFLFLLIMMFSCKEEGSYRGGYYWIYTYGYPRMEFHEATEGISDKWKIRYHSVSGCMIDQKLMDSVNIENKKTYAAIEKKYGHNWRQSYQLGFLQYEHFS